MQVRFENPFSKQSYVFTLNARLTKLEKEVLGVRSNLDRKSIYNDSLHMLMLDCDEIKDEYLIQCLIKLQHEFKLGDAEVYTSSLKTVYFFGLSSKFPFIHVIKKQIKKRHIYFFQDPMTYWRALKIIHYATVELKFVDEAFARWRMARPNMVLRISAKSNGFVPEPDFIIQSTFAKPEVKWFKESVRELLRGEMNGS